MRALVQRVRRARVTVAEAPQRGRRAGDAADADDFGIATHGRYGHARSYVERVLRQAHLDPVIVRAELRMESGVPVAGLVIRAVKSAGLGIGVDSAEASSRSAAEAARRAIGERNA